MKVTFKNGTQARYTCMLNVSDNLDRFEISYNECFSVNFVPDASYVISVSSTCNISMNTTNVQLGPESSRCSLCLCNMYIVCHTYLIIV